MAVTAEGLQFQPLYWVFNDNWQWFIPVSQGLPPVFDHWGHVHLFMMGYDWTSQSQDAFSGAMRFEFALKDIWGPRSDDPNQQHQYEVIGTPQWYFRVEELWRRVYIQPFDEKIDTLNDLARRGLKYEAVAADKISGPYREGRDASPLYIPQARTLPIDYYTSDKFSQAERTNHLARKADELAWAWSTGEAGLRRLELVYGPYPDEFEDRFEMAFGRIYDPATFDLQHGNFLPNTHPAARDPFSDALYIWPIMEYQRVVQLDWERPPGWAEEHDVDDETFGDGWAVTLEVPFRLANGKYNSPFGPAPGVVSPVGTYHGQNTAGDPLVADSQRPRHPEVTYDDPSDPDSWPEPPGEPNFYDSPWKMHPDRSGQLIEFHNPYGSAADGRWVQQCLGGKVHAKARIKLRHRLGGEQWAWVHTTQLLPQTKFSGTDQGAAT